jgi:hypothetical protein
MSRFVRWPRHLGILAAAIVVAGLVATLLVHAMPKPNRVGRRTERPRERREFAGPELAAGAPAFFKQLVIVGVIALVGRKVFRIRI